MIGASAIKKSYLKKIIIGNVKKLMLGSLYILDDGW
jgi:hypothetical protein